MSAASFPLKQLSVVLSLFLFSSWTSRALSLEELRADVQLTPTRFMAYFADFAFELRDRVQTPEEFLASKRGDCDDFATLAATLLGEKGYTARLVLVCTEKGSHVVCYIAEAKGFLDYNNRKTRLLIPSTGSLGDIAQKVASSFKASWYSVSEFMFKQGARHFVCTEFP
jgi:hypothetical protein